MSKYWSGKCPIGDPFDLWRKNYFLANGKLPEDTEKMYPELSPEIVADIASIAVSGDSTLDEVLRKFGDCEAKEQLTMAFAYFNEWRKRAPFLPDSWQDIPLRPARTSPEPLEEFMDDWREHVLGEKE
ncbi:MAG: hypothetical protein FWH57_04140 [Oscillospiraceae bacterium]|nr:hypothetical protein [Oscillospiraceae bacterium]